VARRAGNTDLIRRAQQRPPEDACGKSLTLAVVASEHGGTPSEVEQQDSRPSAGVDAEVPILDTLKLARRLQDAGFTDQRATGAAEALSELVFSDA
jgi:hypothetical protein